VADDITVSAQDLEVAERFLRSALQSVAPAGNFKPGTFLNDVLVRALAYVPALMDKEVGVVRKQQSLLRIGELDVTQATSALEDLASNWFLTRKTGTYATGTVTVHLSPSVPEDVTVPADWEAVYSTGIGFNLDAGTAVVYGRDTDMTAVLGSDGNVSEYVMYVPVICTTEGAIGNVSAGRFSSYDAFSPYITYIENEVDFDNATAGETNAGLIERAPTAISTRNLISARSIDAVLNDELSNIYGLTVIGAGDTEMRRDIISLPIVGSPATQIRVLGHVNVYVLTPIRRAAFFPLGGGTTTLDAEATTIDLTTTAVTGFPFARLKSVKVDGTAFTRVNAADVLGPTNYRVTVTDALLYNSMDQAVQLEFASNALAREVGVEFDGFRDLANVGLILNDRERRVAAANTLALSYYPVVATIGISYYVRDDAPGDFPEAAAKASIATYIDSTLFSGNLRVTDIVTYLLGQYSTYLRGVGYPVTVTYRLQAPSGDEYAYTSTDKITVEDDALLDSGTYATRVAEQVSDRTVKVVTFPDLVTLTAIA